MMKLNRIYVYSVILIVLIIVACSSKEKITNNQLEPRISSDDNRGFFRIMFYNVENLFDTFDDTLKQDEEFLPKGVKYWSEYRYYQKLNRIYKVIVAVGGWQPPEIVGLCEVENRYVLDGLVKYTPLSKFQYEIVHQESPDWRGIDVALLYLKNKFTLLNYKAIPINFPFDINRKTRDILYVKGITKKNDTLHIFVNHWPSRWGGQLESEQNRVFVASVLRNVVDSIFSINPDANIIIMGDLNDDPENTSILKTLNANTSYDNITNNELYNLSYYLKEKKNAGTLKYQGRWNIFDQFIVSGALISPAPDNVGAGKSGSPLRSDKQKSIYLTLDDAYVFKADYLLEKDETYIGYKPFRTYSGYKYINGFSDHLPVFIDLRKK